MTASRWLRKCAMPYRVNRRSLTVVERCPACAWDMQTFRLNTAKVVPINDALG